MQVQNQPKLNWRKSQKDGQYQAAVSSNLAPFLHSTIENNDISEVENEIQTVVSILHEAASASIPVFSRKKKANYFIHDEALKQKKVGIASLPGEAGVKLVNSGQNPCTSK